MNKKIMPFKTRFFASVAGRVLTPKTRVTARTEIPNAQTKYDHNDRSADLAQADARPGCPPHAKEAFASWRARQEDWLERIHQARRDFVEIVPELWS
jgi:hypothetical protein